MMATIGAPFIREELLQQAQRGKALGLISTQAQNSDVRPDQYFPSLEREWVWIPRKMASDCGCSTQI